jgi:predicted nucleotidyltransferase
VTRFDFLFNARDTGGMNSQTVLREIVRRIRREARPQKIVLFGSRARGRPHRHSDYDILVIKKTRNRTPARTIPIYSALSGLPVPIDVVLFTPGEVREWRNVRQAFVTTALREGKVLYEDKNYE